MRRREERGSGAVLAIVMMAVLTTVALGGLVGGGVLVTHRRASSAADLAALAGAETLQASGVAAGGPGCGRAAEISQANGARLVDCQVSGDDVLVRVELAVPGPLGDAWSVTARARAGPVGSRPP